MTQNRCLHPRSSVARLYMKQKEGGKWISNGFLKKETVGTCYLQQSIRTNTIKAKINKQPVSPECRLCEIKEETVMHLDNGHPKLALET